MLAACQEVVPDHLRIEGADPARGAALIRAYGCGSCHAIDGIGGADGTVGPPLADYAARSLVAGIVPNTPPALVAWIMDPPAMDPQTGMPAMNIPEPEAKDIAAYLYTLGAEAASVYPTDRPLEIR